MSQEILNELAKKSQKHNQFFKRKKKEHNILQLVFFFFLKQFYNQYFSIRFEMSLFQVELRYLTETTQFKIFD